MVSRQVQEQGPKVRESVFLASFGKLPLRQVGGSPAGVFPPPRTPAPIPCYIFTTAFLPAVFWWILEPPVQFFLTRVQPLLLARCCLRRTGTLSRAGVCVPSLSSLLGVVFLGTFFLADVDRPILGLDFLVHHKLIVDMAGQQLLDSVDLSVSPLVSSDCKTSSLFTALLDVPPAYRYRLY